MKDKTSSSTTSLGALNSALICSAICSAGTPSWSFAQILAPTLFELRILPLWISRNTTPSSVTVARTLSGIFMGCPPLHTFLKDRSQILPSSRAVRDLHIDWRQELSLHEQNPSDNFRGEFREADGRPSAAFVGPHG